MSRVVQEMVKEKASVSIMEVARLKKHMAFLSDIQERIIQSKKRQRSTLKGIFITCFGRR